MGEQIIRQPDGRLVVFSSIVDSWIASDATPDELIEWYAERAAEDSRRRTRRILDSVLADDPRSAYFQFALTFAEADDIAARHGGRLGESRAETDRRRRMGRHYRRRVRRLAPDFGRAR